jgi:tRNA pseudouridine55 synthase
LAARTQPDAPSGVVIVDKPRGPTSHDVVARARKKLATRHVGHAGTLDPMATGVLVVAVGEGTKLVPWLTADDKAYEATIRLGVATDTLDAEGTETERVSVGAEVLAALRARDFSAPLVAAAFANERARTTQIPPIFSAIRIGGRRAHELAREGVDTEMPERPTSVVSLEATDARAVGDVVELDVRVEAQKGYFVRSLARDLAHALGTVGHLTALRRVRSGGFTIADAIALDAVDRECLMTVTEAASRALPVTVLDDAGARAVSFGQRVSFEQMDRRCAGPSAWLDGEARLVAIGELTDEGYGRVLRGFPKVG